MIYNPVAGSKLLNIKMAEPELTSIPLYPNKTDDREYINPYHTQHVPIEEIHKQYEKYDKQKTVSEITVCIKGDEKSLRQKFLVYTDYKVSADDPTIKTCIATALQDFSGEPSDVTVKISLAVI